MKRIILSLAVFLSAAAAWGQVQNPQSGGFSYPAAGGAWSVPSALDPTGVADNSTAVNSYIASLVSSYFGSTSTLVLPPGKFYVPSLSNIYGVPISGSGILLKTVNQISNNGTINVTATQAQANTYACAVPRLICGQEYESHWLSNVESGTATKGVFTGDSTTLGTNVTGPFKVDQLFLASATQAGITGVTVTNTGVSGANSSQWLATTLATDQALSPDVYFIRYGINDPNIVLGVPNPATTISNIRAGLACIRNGCTGVSAKTVDQETIVLEMPSSVNDNPNNRGEIYYEQLRNGFVQAARDYQAVFIDLYAAFPDNDFTVQTCMMDLPYSGVGVSTPPIHIHPGNCKTVLYNDLLVKALIDPVRVAITPTNLFVASGDAIQGAISTGGANSFTVAANAYYDDSSHNWKLINTGSPAIFMAYNTTGGALGYTLYESPASVSPIVTFTVIESATAAAHTFNQKLIVGGTKFTATGCTSITSTLGNGTAGKFTIGGNTCNVVITINGATGLTAANGWSCGANDETTAAGNTGLYFSANNTTTATLTVPATAAASDVIDFRCASY